MVKKFLFLFIISLMLIFSLNSVGIKSTEIKDSLNLIEINSEGQGELLAELKESRGIELWHYSGGYWQWSFNGTDLFRISDSIYSEDWERLEYLAQEIQKSGDFYNNPIFEIELPQQVKDYLQSNHLDDIEISIEIDQSYGNLNAYDLFMFDNNSNPNLSISPRYKINNEKLYIYALPLFNCYGDYNFIPGLNKTIPIVKEGYGLNVYSIWEDGKHLGRALGSHTEEPGKVHYGMIKNAEGELEGGYTIDLFDYYQIGSTQSDNSRIGWGTFKDAGAVGLHFWYPMIIRFYAKEEAGIVHINHFLEDGTPLARYDYTEEVTKDSTHTQTATKLANYDFQGSKIDYDKPPTGSITNQKDYTIRFDGSFSNVYIYYYYAPKDNNVGDTQQDPNAKSVIKADNRGDEKFDVSKGIPVTEKLYINVSGKNHLIDYKLKQITGYEEYSVKVSKDYILEWVDEKGETKTETETVERHYSIDRDYSYWTIDYLAIYGLDKAEVQNHALPDGKVTLTPNNYHPPQIEVWHSKEKREHIRHASNPDVTLPPETLIGTGDKPNIPNENWRSHADQAVGSIQVKNDKLIIEGVTILSDDWRYTHTNDPGIISESEDIGQDVLYKNNIVISQGIPNGTYTSSGNIQYKLMESINWTGEAHIIKAIEHINSVTIHTPITNYPSIDAREDLNQQINPVERQVLVLDESFTLNLPNTGQHRIILGYGTNNYEKYIKTKQVAFSFDCYIGTDKTGTYLPKNTWHFLHTYQQNLKIYIPTWAEEGNHEVRVKNQALNCPSGVETYQYNANISLDTYWAVERLPVHLQGRIHSLTITSVEDMNWEPFFRIDGTAKHTGKIFHTGSKGPSGNQVLHTYTLPIMPTKNDIKGYETYATKLGYRFDFNLITTGQMYDENDYIEIIPKFYYIPYNGSTRQEVDLWYTTGSNLIKIGSTNDTYNYTMTLNNTYRNIQKQELLDTARIFYEKNGKAEGKSLKDYENNFLYGEDTFIGRPYKLMLDQNVRTFVGNTTNLPASVTKEKALQSVQKWYGSYFLPNTTFAVSKDLDLTKYRSVTMDSEFILKEGYIIVQFQIRTLDNFQNNGQPVSNYYKLDYITPVCNQWEVEGYNRSQQGLTLNYGDIIFYYTDKRASEDYKVGR